MWKHRIVIYVILITLVITGAVFSLAVGTLGVGIGAAWSDEVGRDAYRQLMIPRLLLGMLAGAALSVTGAMFQALFRNPLASPYTLGVSSGASLGAIVAIALFKGRALLSVAWTLGEDTYELALSSMTVSAFIGALVVVILVYVVAHLRRGQSIGVLLLAGITISFICSAILVLMMYFLGQHDLAVAVRWMMGEVKPVGMNPVLEAALMTLIAMSIAVYLHRDLDLLMMSETIAASRGVNVPRARRLIYFSASLLTAGIIAHCGPIGFVGLMIPHIVRHFVGSSHRYVIPACALAGAAFLPICDTLARNILLWLNHQHRELPVGVLTNLIGGAFFLGLLMRRRAGNLLT